MKTPRPSRDPHSPDHHRSGDTPPAPANENIQSLGKVDLKVCGLTPLCFDLGQEGALRISHPRRRDADGFGAEDILRLTDVSRETLERIATVINVLDRWRTTYNLIGPSERDHLWRRHVLDSVQIWPYRCAETSAWIDLGSGAGFPGLITACMAASTNSSFTLVESSGKKASFLRAASREADLSVTVKSERIESVSRETPGPHRRPRSP